MKKKVTKILTGFRIDPRVKALAMKAAAQENRSLSNYIEQLIRNDLVTRGLIVATSFD
jgi:predicted HicB family RNase H-like nuclease